MPPKFYSSKADILREIIGSYFVDRNGRRFAVEELYKHTSVIALYFAANWCQRSKRVTPRLISYYNKLRESGRHDFEIILVTPMKEEGSFQQYFATMPWLAVDFKEIYARITIAEKFGADKLPTLILINSKTGEVIDADGISRIDQSWTPPVASNNNNSSNNNN